MNSCPLTSGEWSAVVEQADTNSRNVLWGSKRRARQMRESDQTYGSVRIPHLLLPTQTVRANPRLASSVVHLRACQGARRQSRICANLSSVALCLRGESSTGLVNSRMQLGHGMLGTSERLKEFCAWFILTSQNFVHSVKNSSILSTGNSEEPYFTALENIRASLNIA